MNAGTPHCSASTGSGEVSNVASQQASRLQKIATNSVQGIQPIVPNPRPECGALRKWPQAGSRCTSNSKSREACGVVPTIQQRLEMLERSCAVLADERNMDRKRSEDLQETVVQLQERRAADQQRIAHLSQVLTNAFQPSLASGCAAHTSSPQARPALPQIFGISTPRERSLSERQSVEEFLISTPRKMETAKRRAAKSPRKAIWSSASQTLRQLASSVADVGPRRMGQRIIAKVLLSREQQCLTRRHTARVAAFGFVVAAWQCGRADLCLWARAVLSVAASPSSCFGRLLAGAQRMRALRRALTCIAAVATLTGMPPWVHAAAQLLSLRPLPKALCR